MSVYRTHFYIIFDTLAHATTVRDSILSTLATKPSLSDVTADISEDEDERPKVDGSFFYETTSSRDIVNDWVNKQRTTAPVKNWLKTGWVCWHKWDANLNMNDPACEFGEIGF